MNKCITLSTFFFLAYQYFEYIWQSLVPTYLLRSLHLANIPQLVPTATEDFKACLKPRDENVMATEQVYTIKDL